MMKTFLLLSLLMLSINSSWSAENTWLNKEFVHDAFMEVALKNEYSAGDKPLIKWKSPVRIWVEHKVPDIALHDDLTDAHISHLSQVTGHPIYRVQNREQANVIWVYTRESMWRDDVGSLISKAATKNLHGAICKAGYRNKMPSGEIHYAAIVIPVDQAREHGKLLACIVEEITQILGLPNDSLKAYPSIFNDETPEDLLSPLDIVLLKLLYHPELKSGMYKGEVSPVLKRLIDKFESDGTLQQAVQLSKQAPLYQLAGY
ncbi:DUF2927 domain-containing protein [Vibrio sonorensis]|uniref:DUF2927 domain-containing protein n=1 Tax=Vibrio sonorensis TaxID=1004316 RepID=UPI0008DA5905|nr:DUF2927 domain-containing protein [Vibrio sonorensis]